MDITQAFYDSIAAQYDKLFLDWHATTREQSVILDRIFHSHCFDRSAALLDCACNIGTQAIGLAALGYSVTASDISRGELAEAAKRAAEHSVSIRFEQADFRALVRTFPENFDIVICNGQRASPYALPRSSGVRRQQHHRQAPGRRHIGRQHPGLWCPAPGKAALFSPPISTRAKKVSGCPSRSGPGREITAS